MQILLATGNPGKVKEFQNALKPLGHEILSAQDFNLPEVEETGQSFKDNALIKARNAFAHTKRPSLADDSGLAVHALNCEPGVYSARWAGPEQNYNKAMRSIHEKLADKKDRSASFICVLCLISCENETPVFFEGRVEGKLTWPPRGEKGFGYDPFFIPDESPDKTFAEMNVSDKQRISHRGRAIQKLTEYLEITKF